MKFSKAKAITILVDSVNSNSNGYKRMNVELLKSLIALKNAKVFKEKNKNYDFCFILNGIAFGLQLNYNDIKIGQDWYNLEKSCTNNFLNCLTLLMDSENELIHKEVLKRI